MIRSELLLTSGFSVSFVNQLHKRVVSVPVKVGAAPPPVSSDVDTVCLKDFHYIFNGTAVSSSIIAEDDHVVPPEVTK